MSINSRAICSGLSALLRREEAPEEALTKPNTGERNVTLLVKRTLGLALAIALSISSLSTATAQGPKSAETGLKPVAVVSLASIKETLNDIGYVTRLAGMADQGDTARFFASAMTSGIDKERPIGLY